MPPVLPPNRPKILESPSALSPLLPLSPKLVCLRLRRRPQGLYPVLKPALCWPPPSAPLSTAPPRSPAPTPRMPPSMSSLPVLMNLVSVDTASWLLVLVLPEDEDDDEDDDDDDDDDPPPPNLSWL